MYIQKVTSHWLTYLAVCNFLCAIDLCHSLCKLLFPSSDPVPVLVINLISSILTESQPIHPPHPGKQRQSHLQTTQGTEIWYGVFIQHNQVNQLTTSSIHQLPLAAASYSKLGLIQLFQVRLKQCKLESQLSTSYQQLQLVLCLLLNFYCILHISTVFHLQRLKRWIISE